MAGASEVHHEPSQDNFSSVPNCSLAGFHGPEEMLHQGLEDWHHIGGRQAPLDDSSEEEMFPTPHSSDDQIQFDGAASIGIQNPF